MSFNFTVIKKNQILAGAVTLMLVTAGYLNYKYDPTKPYDIEVTGLIEDNLGDAVLVDSKGVVKDFNNEEIGSSNYTIDYVDAADSIVPVFKNETELKNTGAEIQNNNQDYFILTRIDRTNQYAEEIESYENILEGTNTSETQKERAQSEIERINGIRNSIMIAENLIKLKGFKDVAILVSENSINVIVAAENLNSTEVAQIQSIIMNEFSTSIENVHITNREKN